jgi:hypothetical protein
MLREVLMQSLLSPRLVDVNMKIIEGIMTYLDLKMPRIYYASELVGDCDDPSERIIKICKAIGNKAIIVGSGKSLEVHNWQKIVGRGLDVYIQEYLVNHPVYEQSRRKQIGFQKGLSIIDAILNVGRKETKKFLIDGRYDPVYLRIS